MLMQITVWTEDCLKDVLSLCSLAILDVLALAEYVLF